MIRAGRLRHEVTIQSRKTPEQDGIGGLVDAWEDVTSCAALVEPLAVFTSRELHVSERLAAVVDTRVTMRFFEGVTPKMRLIFNERIIDIEAVINVGERDREMILLCQERIDGRA